MESEGNIAMSGELSHFENGGRFAIQNGRIYYNGTSGVRVVTFDGIDIQTMHNVRPKSIYIYGDEIYYSDLNNNKIYSVKIDGTAKKKLCDDSAEDFRVSGNRIYFDSVGQTDIYYKMKTDGTDRIKLEIDNYTASVSMLSMIGALLELICLSKMATVGFR